MCVILGSLIIGTAAISAGPAMKAATSKNYKNKVTAMKKGKFEYIAIGEVNFRYTRPLRGTNINDPMYSSIAQLKQNGNSRILAVVRKRNGSINFVLLKRPDKNKRFNKKSPLNSCSIDPNLKANQDGIIAESHDLKVIRKNSNTFQIEDTNYHAVQTHRKVFEIQIKNTRRTTNVNGRLSGISLYEMLNHMAKRGRVPKDFPSIATRDDMTKEENKTFSSSLSSFSSSSISSSSFSTVTVESSESEDSNSLPATNDVISSISSSAESALTSEYEEFDAVITIANATVTVTVTSEYDEEVIPVAIATPV
jgi:hypothetical protein